MVGGCVAGRGACMVGEVCVAKVGGGVGPWQERPPLQRTVRVLLESILVVNRIQVVGAGTGLASADINPRRSL